MPAQMDEVHFFRSPGCHKFRIHRSSDLVYPRLMPISRRSMFALPMALLVPDVKSLNEPVRSKRKIISILVLEHGDWYIAEILSPPPHYAGTTVTQLKAARKWHEAMRAIKTQAELQGLQIDITKSVEIELLQAGGETWLPHEGGPLTMEHTAAFDPNRDDMLTLAALKARVENHRNSSARLALTKPRWCQVRITVHTT